MGSVVVSNIVLLVVAALVVVGTLSSLLAARFGAPILLVFLVVGVAAGEGGPGGIHFDDYWATYMVGSAALAVILFDGGLRMRVASMRGAILPAVGLSTVGVAFTAALVALVAAPLLGLGWMEALLVGAIVASTDAAAVLFLVRAQGLHLGRRVGSVIEIESATNDPAAVFLTVLLVELLTSHLADPGLMVVFGALREMVVGAVLGVAGGYALVALLNRVDLPGGLHPVMVVGVAVLLFALTSLLHGSGFLAVYLAGLVVGNRPVRAIASITSFLDTITWLCQIVMFVMLGMLVSPEKILQYALPALGVAAFLILVGRPAAVFACLAPFHFSLKEKLFVSWAGLRGAVSIFLATIPMLAHLPMAEVYFNVAFAVVLVSLILHGWTMAYAARRLDVALSDPDPGVRRFEIDLPGQTDMELVAYPVMAATPAVGQAQLPPWARLVMVVRANETLTPEAAGPLKAGDYGYLLAPPKRVHQLDRMFRPEETTPLDDSAAFPFVGEVRLGDLASFYGLAVPDSELGLTIADAFADRSDDQPAPGMRIAYGHAVIEVRGVTDGRVTYAVLRLEAGRLKRSIARVRRLLGFPPEQDEDDE
ncbi:cell volume regulation protein A [Xanthobacter flavus]|uniref:Cell volume regulation protein A n=2 Tax=Xanthobacter TaxID=279 RepID=A0ABU1KC73_XANFL|nr:MULTISPECIES: potassium/proton antiporter [Xanthobacter]MBN8915419.1 potassium/proton antiporter [Hyphomicrobiales bacterium]UJX45114.1 potassium/proton antiporter [Xanthobacter sp. YC-JY1]MDR6332438.1 cell volume regulation protein A [Xanthobacter flavus]NMN56654.1 cell volume regulation protein A [Xanthobacter sp. SG618]UDQ89105.1 potassium/proton antiporter [Xanthobacter autotrophicus]